MYVCICNVVTENQIVEAVKSGARSLADLRRDLGVSAECGACANFAQETLERAKEAQRQTARSAPASP